MRLIRLAVALGVLAGMLGCGDNSTTVQPDAGDAAADVAVSVDATPDAAVDTGVPPACSVPRSDVVGYQNCGKLMKGGLVCIFNCGDLPFDGGAVNLLGPGCTVQIGTSTFVTALCVSSCAECQ